MSAGWTPADGTSEPSVRCPPRTGLPEPRGPLTEHLLRELRGEPHHLDGPVARSDDPLGDEDLQLALYCCYELHYRGLPGVSDDWEWEPSLLALRGRLERLLEAQLHAELPGSAVRSGDVAETLWDMTGAGGRSLSGWLLERGTRVHAQELAVHRSGYQLKEADPHTWAIPRLTDRAKAAMVTIQTDEYGLGVARDMHSALFAETMRALGLDHAYGAYLDWLPAPTLATTNLISLFGLHRRLRGALVGHLAGFEMNSVGPMSRYATWLKRLGLASEGLRFYEVHVEADEVHQHIAVQDLVGGLLEIEPGLADAVLFGARALAMVEGRFADRLWTRWESGNTSLYTPASARLLVERLP